MIKLNPISDKPLEVYDAIVNKKNKARRKRLQRLRPKIETAYKEYDRVKPELEKIEALTFARRKKDLIHCYENSTWDRNRLYNKVVKLAWRCPYCTSGTVATLDHYLPKDDYPEFSILPDNLVPSCHRCNTPRGFKDRAGSRALIHPYFDPIPPDDRLLFAAVDIEKRLPKADFSVKTDSATNPVFAELYARHFDLLSLGERYGEAAVETLSGMVRHIRVWSQGFGRADVQARLVEQATADERALGANSFQVALTRGAAASDAFLDYCLGGAS